MDDLDQSANIATSVRMANNVKTARIVGALNFVSTADGGIDAKRAAASPFVHTVKNGIDAASAEAPVYANTADDGMTARSAMGQASVNMADDVVPAKTVAATDTVSTCDGSRLCRNKSALCATKGNVRYDGYCTHCFANLYPNDPRTANIRCKSKEVMWVNALLQTEIAADYDWRWDKPLYVIYNGGCCNSKRRIDLWTLVGNTIVAVEIDESQHKAYPSDYEATRYNDLLADFTGRFVFLRINPDPFVDIRGVRIDPRFDVRVAEVEKSLADVMKDLVGDKENNDELVVIRHFFYDES